MIVICEECGKKYRIDPSKIKGKAAAFKCRACSHRIVVSRPSALQAKPQGPAAPAIEQAAATMDDISQGKPAQPALATGRRTRFGLRPKMLLLFLLIPLLLMAGASILFLWQLEKTSTLLTRSGSRLVNQMAEEKIANLSSAVAMQCGLYLANHPDLKRENFNTDMGFKSLAVQKVGLTGYTALYQLPGNDGIWRTWAHPNSKIIGIDMRKLKKSLGKNFDGFWKIYTGVRKGKKSQGYYTWQDKDGKFRDKFMVCTPVPGTPYVIAATTYMDEFTGPVQRMRIQAQALTDRARMITWAVLGATLLLIGLIVSIYGHRLTGRIKSLTDVADRISVGDLAVEVDTSASDEIGDLAEAIARMQDSIRLSIERLRRRRLQRP